MKKKDQEMLTPKMPELHEKVNAILKEAGLEDFEVKTLLFKNKNEKRRKDCPDGKKWKLVTVPNGLEWKCV